MHLVAITAKPVDFAKALDRIVGGVQQTVDDADRDFQKTVRTWKGKPRFDKSVKAQADRVEGRVSTTSDIYRFVSGGTRVRYATMTPDFVAKTVSGWVGSRPGRGGLLYVNKNRPRPGIKPRGFDKEIARKLAPYFFRYMEMVMRQIARESGHGA